MAKSPVRQHEDKERREEKIAEQAAAQRGPVPPEIGESVGDNLEEHPPHEQVSRLGSQAEEADAELERRRQTDFEGKVTARRRASKTKFLIFLVLALIVVVGGIWGIST